MLSRPEYNIKVHLWSVFRLLLDAPDTRHLYNARNKSSWCKTCPCLVQQRSECCSTPSMYSVIMKLQQSQSRCCSLWMAAKRVIDGSIQVVYMTFIPFNPLCNHIFSKYLPLSNASSWLPWYMSGSYDNHLSAAYCWMMKRVYWCMMIIRSLSCCVKVKHLYIIVNTCFQ